MPNKKYTFIDLFAGAGGLSEGFYIEGSYTIRCKSYFTNWNNEF